MASERARRPTSTSSFGVGRREAHDSSEFYARFTPPTTSDDDQVSGPIDLTDRFLCGDSRKMVELPDASVALVVTSPPYFVGKDYERDVARAEVPETYVSYLGMLEEVFEECVRVLEPGGRIAVNVANLGRKPYRSLSADVIGILQDRLGLLLRGEVVWRKSRGSTGSCAWGTFRSPANPVLRDLTERVVVASKGRFDRARSPARRREDSLPHVATTTSDEFMEATLDLWEIEAESAKRVGHPAPFPVELPQRLIQLYTYEGDLVLDPFMGSGSTLAAAAASGRRYVGYDLDPSYVAIARERVALAEAEGIDERSARASREGKAVLDIADQQLRAAGFSDVRRQVRLRGLGITMSLVADDELGRPWHFDVSGTFNSVRPGLAGTDAAWRFLGLAHVLANQGVAPVVLLTAKLPAAGSEGDRALHKATTKAFFDAVELLTAEGAARLAAYAGGAAQPVAGFWSSSELATS